MKITTLEYFIAVAEAGSIRAAAQKLYLAQPSLTKSLQSMEQELGVQLFTRTSSGIRLTIAGETILPQARQVIALYNGWLELGTVTSLKKVDVYSHISLAEFLVPDILLRLRESYPELTVSYRTEAQPERYLSADSQEPHLILTLGSPQVDLSRELKALNNRKVVLASGVYGCLVNRLSPLAQRESLTFSDLKKYYLAFPNHTLEPMNQSDSALAAIDQFLPDLVRTITDKHIVEVGTVNSVVELVRQHTDTYAIAFAPTHYRYSGVQTGELVCVPLQEKGVEAELQLLYPVRAFQQHPSFRSLVNNLKSEMQRFVQVHLPA